MIIYMHKTFIFPFIPPIWMAPSPVLESYLSTTDVEYASHQAKCITAGYVLPVTLTWEMKTKLKSYSPVGWGLN